MGEPNTFPRSDKPEACQYHLPAALPYPCPNCYCGAADDPIAALLANHYLTSVNCQHYEDGTGDNAPSCWCGWQGERVPSVGRAVRAWAEHAAAALRNDGATDK